MYDDSNLSLDTSSSLEQIKVKYLQEIDCIMGTNNTDLSRFSWAENRHLKMHSIKIFNASETDTVNEYLIFASKSSKDSWVTADFFQKTHNFSFESQIGSKNKFVYLIINGLLNKDLKDEIIPTSIATTFIDHSTSITQSTSLIKWAKSFADNEFNEFQDQLIKNNQVAAFPLTQNKLFIDTYHFDKMLSILNNSQFTDEFNQCLFAYQNQKWFLCAAGLESCLEHLMLLTLINYHKVNQLGRNPTATDYLKAFTKSPINLDSRQQTFIDTLFRLRNSVDHHNSGITSKRICDMILDGMTTVYNEYYLPSTESIK